MEQDTPNFEKQTPNPPKKKNEKKKSTKSRLRHEEKLNRRDSDGSNVSSIMVCSDLSITRTPPMLDLFTITQGIDLWVMNLLNEGWPQNKKVRNVPDPLSDLKPMLARARNEGAENIHLKLREISWHERLSTLLLEDLPPPKTHWDELTYVLFKSCAVLNPDDGCYYHGFGVQGIPIHGLVFLREIMGRLNVIEMYDHVEFSSSSSSSSPSLLPTFSFGLPKEEDGGALEQRLKKCPLPTKLELSNPESLPGMVVKYGKWLEEWRATRIWEETCKFEIYRRYMKECLSEVCTSLVELSDFNIKKLEFEASQHAEVYPNESPRIIELEKGIVDRFMTGKLFFKHATYNAGVIVNSEIMLCPDLSSSEGVSDRNKRFGHNKYVFGRMEFTDDHWQTRFGDERIMFEIRDLGDAISISLHDQAQPFSTGKEKDDDWPGHTQLIEDQGVYLRYIGGRRNQRSWTQSYATTKDKLSDAALELLKRLNWKPLNYSNSFVQEIFVGQTSCRKGLALSFIRELRRIRRAVRELMRKAEEASELKGVDGAAVEELKNYALKARRAYQNLMKSIEDALENPKAFQDIFKQFFRVEIRVPAYINLTEIKDLRCIIKTKKETKQFTPIQFEKFEMRCTIVHKILVECRACVALLEQSKDKRFKLSAVPFLLGVCATFVDGAKWTDDKAFVKINVKDLEQIENVLTLINDLMGYYNQNLGFQQCPACGTCSSLTEAVGMLDAPGECTKCGEQALVCWNPPVDGDASRFGELFSLLAESISKEIRL